jgi:hypothetical protein
MFEVGNQASQKVYWYHTSFVNYLEKLRTEAIPALSHLGTWDWEQLLYMRHDLSFILAQDGPGWGVLGKIFILKGREKLFFA